MSTETKAPIPAHIRLLAAAFLLAPKGTDGRWLAFDRFVRACADAGVDHDAVLDHQLGHAQAPVYAAAPELLAMLEDLLEVVEPPEPGCACHINPPCRDCVEHAGTREAVSNARILIATVKGETK